MVTPELFLTSIVTSRSSKKAFESISNSTLAVSASPSPSLSEVVVLFSEIVAGDVILAASASIVP